MEDENGSFMKSTYIVTDNIISPIGFDTETNLQGVINGISGISQINNPLLSNYPFYATGLQNFPVLNQEGNFTRFETLCIAPINNVLQQTSISLLDKETV